MRSYIVMMVLAFLCLSGRSYATTYYVDFHNGNDAWSGTLQAPNNTSTDGPWKTLAKVSKTPFNPGDLIDFKCGDTWTGQLTISSSGTAEYPITYGSYGSCDGSNNPIITEAQKVSVPWSVYNGNIYRADIGAELAADPDAKPPLTTGTYKGDNFNDYGQVFADGTYLRLAQYPCPPTSGSVLSICQGANGPSNYLTITGPNNDTSDYTSLTASALSNIPSTDTLIGAGIYIRTVRWAIDKSSVESMPDSSTIDLSLRTAYSIQPGYGFYLDNELWMLAAPGEWYYDPTHQYLYVWLPDGSDPNDHSITYSVAGYGVRDYGKSDIQISDWDIEKAAYDGIVLDQADNFVINNVTVNDSGETGIYVDHSGTSTAQGSTISNSTISNSVNDGIDIENSSGIAVTGNRVLHSGTVGSPKESLAAINVMSKPNTTNDNISDNSVEYSGYNGIRFGEDSTVEDNYVAYACEVLDGCGGIYTWNGGTTPISTDMNSYVTDNLIQHMIGNTDGTPPSNYMTNASGIYLDNNTNDVTVSGNTVDDADIGLRMNQPVNNTIDGNTFYGSRQASLQINQLTNDPPVTGNAIADNEFFPTSSVPAIWLTSYDGSYDFGSFDNNHYSSIYSPVIAEEAVAGPGITALTTKSSTQYDTFAQWTDTGQDQSSVDFYPFNIDQFSYSQAAVGSGIANQIENGNFSQDSVYPWKSVAAGNPPSETNLSTVSCASEGSYCLEYNEPETSGGEVFSNNFSVQAGRIYLVRFDIASPDLPQSVDQDSAQESDQDVQNVDVSISEGGPSTYRPVLGLSKMISVGPSWQTHSYIFKATGSDVVGDLPNTLGARLDFDVYTDSPIEIGNVEVKDITAPSQVTYDEPTNDSILFANTSISDEQQTSCPDSSDKCGEYIDFPSGDPVGAWPTLQPLASAIMVWNQNNPASHDSDHDGVLDTGTDGSVLDWCPDTPAGTSVDAFGCSYEQNHSADLIPSAVSATEQGGTYTISDTADNDGGVAAGSFTVGYYLSPTSTYDSNTAVALLEPGSGTACTRNVAGLAPHTASIASGTTCYRPAGVPNGYYVVVVDDVDNTVPESDEGNNVAVVTKN